MSFFLKCPFALGPISPGAHLTQILIFPKSQFAPVPIYFDAHLPRVLFCHLLGSHVPRCFFATSAHLPQVSVYSKFSIFPNAHLPQVPNSPGPKCLGPSICPGPILSNSVPCSLINGFLRFYSVKCGLI